MHVVLSDLGLERLWVIYPGETRYPLAERIEVVPFREVPDLLARHALLES